MWYILLKEEQLGPMSRAEVVELFRQGVIDGETLVWRQGLSEWGDLAHTAEFSELTDGSVEGSEASLYDDDEDEDDATLIANPADEDLQAALAELLGEPLPTSQGPPPSVAASSIQNSLPITASMTQASEASDESADVKVTTGEFDPILDEDDDVDPDDELVDVHSVLSVATHTLDDIVDEVLKPSAQQLTGSKPKTVAAETNSEQEEKATIAFPMPAGLMVADDVETATAPLISKTAFKAAVDASDAGDDNLEDPSVVALGSIDIDSFEDDPAYEDGSRSTPPGEVLDPSSSVQPDLEVAIPNGPQASDVGTAGLPDVAAAPVRDSDTELQTSHESQSARLTPAPVSSSRNWPLIGLLVGLVLGSVAVGVYLMQRAGTPVAPALAPKRLVIKTVQKDAAPAVDAGPESEVMDATIKQKALDASPPPTVPDMGQPRKKQPAPVRGSSSKKTNRAQKSAPKKSPDVKGRPGKKGREVAQTKTIATAKPPSKTKRTGTLNEQASTSTKNTSGVFKRGNQTKRPLTLSRQKITKVLRKNQKRLAKCVAQNPTLKNRLVSVAIQIKRNGKVGRARIASSLARGTPAGACIEGQVKTYRFPPFRGDPMSITLPIRLK